MSRVSPFAGLSFDQARVGPLERVTTPPYDTITPEEQRRFREASPHSIVRLDIAEEQPDDDGVRDKYRRAASELDRWRGEGVLVPAARSAYYPYEMRFTLEGQHRHVRGLICQVELEPWGGSIIPHERTMPGPIEDRLLLLRALRSNLSPVYALLSSRCSPFDELLDRVAEEPPARWVTDEAGVDHRMWVLEDGGGIPGWFQEEPLLIADGHHRYTVALRYRDEMRDRRGPGPWDQIMMLVVDAVSQNPPVLPIHRVLLHGPTPASAGARVRDLGEVLSEVSDDMLVYGVATREGRGVVHRIARLDGRPPAVCALHEQVLDGVAEGALRFTPDAEAAERAVRTREATAAFFLPGTNAERIRAVIDRGERLPQKSTYFWPKPRTGMVIRILE